MKNETKEVIWNKRLKQCIKDAGLTQEQFVDALNEKYDTKFKQKYVSRWIRVGERDGNKETIIGFPKMETIIMIAGFFNKPVSYFIGETDGSTYTTGQAMEYTGLSEQAISILHKLSHVMLYKIEGGTEILSKLIEIGFEDGILFDLGTLKSCVDSENDADEKYAREMEMIREELGDEGFAEIKQYIVVPDEELPQLTERQYDALQRANKCHVDFISTVHGNTYTYDVGRYKVSKAFDAILDKIFPPR